MCMVFSNSLWLLSILQIKLVSLSAYGNSESVLFPQQLYVIVAAQLISRLKFLKFLIYL